MPEIIIQCHRGAGMLAPENTLEAFELAWAMCTAPEADVRTTRDGVIVAFHDDNFTRVVKGASAELQQRGVADVTFAELAALDVGAWQGEQFMGRRVARLAQAFALMAGMPERLLYMDIKNVDLPQLAGEVLAHHVAAQVVFAGPEQQLLRQWHMLVPAAQTLLWMGGTESELQARFAALRATHFAGVTQLQIHIHPNPDSAAAEPFALSRAFLRAIGVELRARGILYQALPFGATTPATYQQLLDLGVASLATDHPDVTLRAVREYQVRDVGECCD